jgi:mutator protein MutT
MSNYNTQRPYLASYIMFRNDKDEVAFLLRAGDRWMTGHYGLPAGKVEKGESFTACAVREAKEEVGVTVKAEDLKHVMTDHRHEVEDIENDWVDIFFEATKWEGQLFNAEPDVHSELKWFSLDSLPANMVPNVHAVLKKLQKGVRYTELDWDKV